MDKLRILHVSPEVGPFARTGGMADVVWALSKELKRELGHDVRVIMPKYKLPGQQEAFGSMKELGSLHVLLGKDVEHVHIEEGRPKEIDIPLYLIHDKNYLYRDRLYGYLDDTERFILFCRATLEMLKRLNWMPDVIHCHDWTTGLIPGYKKLIPEYRELFDSLAIVYTIHNIQHQGSYPLEVFDLAGLSDQKWPISAYWHYEHFCFKKGALVFADLITTVSETYAQEIQESEIDGVQFGYGLEGVLKSRRDFLQGIVNGIDYEKWNPDGDKYIQKYYETKDGEKLKRRKKAPHFSVKDIPVGPGTTCHGKSKLRAELESICRWTPDPETMIIGRIGRICAQKDRILMMDNALQKMVRTLNVRFVILGRVAPGDEEGERYRQKFEELHRDYRNKVCFLNIEYANMTREEDEWYEHLIYAGADAFLMPSLFEPCGLSQQQSHRYGTLPIVRATGGLVDTVAGHDAPGGKGDGFVFEKPSGEDMIENGVKKALEVYKGERETTWRELMRNAMRRDHTWFTSAKRYEELYYLCQKAI